MDKQLSKLQNHLDAAIVSIDIMKKNYKESISSYLLFIKRAQVMLRNNNVNLHSLKQENGEQFQDNKKLIDDIDEFLKDKQ